MNILGISAFYHDSAACLVQDGWIASAAQEERFTRKKHDHSFPKSAINYCLENSGLKVTDLDYVAFYDKPFLKFERIMMTYLTYAPVGIQSFIKAMPLWIKQKLWLKEFIKKELNFEGKIIFPEHHESHAASAFFPSPFQDAAVLTLDGVGEWATTSFGVGNDNRIDILSEIHFPHSLGLLYSAFTYYTGFKVNSGEYKVMGLAPYGEPRYKDLILSELMDLKEDGSFQLNCVGNGKILREGPFENIWIQPSAGDAGGALGAALFVWYQYLENVRITNGKKDSQQGSYLGPKFETGHITDFLRKNNIPYIEIKYEEIPEKIADLIADQKVIGWFQGRMEFGPRALGGRSIIGDARSQKMQEVMNLKIKFRESFRPFAPAVTRERVSDYFEIDRDSPYMLLVAPVKKEICREMSVEEQNLFGIDKLNVVRSDIPAVTHVDYSARIQTVNKEDNSLFYQMIKKFDEKYGCPVIINTSFNVRGEPIVCSPDDAYLCFMRTNMDYLIMENILIEKKEQKPLDKDIDWLKKYELD